MVHQRDPDMLPDSAFETGGLEHLVPGNRGRLLDPRRTPVRVVAVAPDSGHFVVEIEDFEDRGARWEVPFESIDRYQFEPHGARAADRDVSDWRVVIDRLDRPLRVPRDAARGAETARTLTRLTNEASTWLDRRSRHFSSGAVLDLGTRSGSAALYDDFGAYMEEQKVRDLEEAFAARFVSNPYSGELVKGHRIVLAELGLVAFEGKAIRDPTLFAGAWRRERRAHHLLARLAFVRAVFRKAGLESVTLYRGLTCDGVPEPPRNETFVSASFDLEVAMSCFDAHGRPENGLLVRQRVPIERLFMSFFETEAMNRQFLEAEAVLLFEDGNPLF